MDDKENIENCYRQMYHGMIDKDHALLSEVLDQSFVLVHMTGMRQSKEEFIRAVENGTLNYFSANHQYMDTEIQGRQGEADRPERCKCCGIRRRAAYMAAQLKVTLIRDADTWRITEAKASTY